MGRTLIKLHAKGSFFMHHVVSKYSLKMLSYPFSSVKERQKTREHQKIQWSDNEDRLIWSTKHAKYDYNCTVIYPWGFSNQKLKLRLINSPIIRSLSLFAIYKYISQKLCIYQRLWSKRGQDPPKTRKNVDNLDEVFTLPEKMNVWIVCFLLIRTKIRSECRHM